MQEFTERVAPHQLAFDAYGAQMRICTNDPDLLPRVESIMPPGWHRRPRSSAQQRLGLLDEGDDWYSIYRHDGACIHDAPGREYALMQLDSQIQSHVALEAPEFIFIHAGVVADDRSALLLPGLSFAGKTTLVRSLIEAGALYYSDEFAVLDAMGHVHPYAKPLSFRPPDPPPEGDTVEYRVDQLGGVAGEEPLPVGLVVAARYRPGARWDPEPLSHGAGALSLLENAVAGQDRPDQAIRHISRAIQGATVLRGERGEADEIAGQLLEALRAAA
jgi:hypothetical protein